MSDTLLEMELQEILISTHLDGPQVVVLAEKNGSRRFPIFIGPHEAAALDMAAHGEKRERPLAHDLLVNTVEALGAKLERIVVLRLEGNTFYGALELRTASGEIVRADSRPSDALVLATKTGAAIFVSESILEQVAESSDESDDDEAPENE